VRRYPRRSRAGAVLLAAAIGTLPGCARSIDGTPVSPSDAAMPPSMLPTPKTPPPQQRRYFDISQLSKLQDQFPPGFDRVQNTTIAPLGADAEKFFAVGVGDIVKVDPPLCRSVLQPVRAPQDAQYTMVGALGRGVILVGAVSSPTPLGKPVVPKGCEEVSLTQRVGGRVVVSTVTRQPGPPIDGVVTTESIAVSAQGATKSYVFAAFLSDTVAVTSEGVLPGNPAAEDLLSGMLVKAVNALRAP
jgi:Domain of unknown function (DUF5642)